MKWWKKSAVIILVAAAGQIVDVAAAEAQTSPLRIFDDAKSGKQLSLAPLAYQLFCLSAPEECRGGGAHQIRFTASLIADLQRVNRSVNESMRFVRERGDRWRSNAQSGDCEDFALAKRKRLIELGLPAGALRLAVATNSRGEGHAVLIVRTSRGDLVLDNTRHTILRRQDTAYRWLAMASADPRRWERL